MPTAPKRTVSKPRPSARKPRAVAFKVVQSAAPSQQRIAERAFELYLSRHGSIGTALGDWLLAEAELSKTG